MAVVAQYCFHHHDPRLPSLALLLLKRISALVSMPILACLGNHAEPVRDILLYRLQARTEVANLYYSVFGVLVSDVTHGCLLLTGCASEGEHSRINDSLCGEPTWLPRNVPQSETSATQPHVTAAKRRRQQSCRPIKIEQKHRRPIRLELLADHTRTNSTRKTGTLEHFSILNSASTFFGLMFFFIVLGFVFVSRRTLLCGRRVRRSFVARRASNCY